MAGGGDPIIVGDPPAPIDLGGGYVLGIATLGIGPASSYLSLTGEDGYAYEVADLHGSLPSGVLSLNDGTIGGVPLSGITYGLPDAGLIQWNVTPSGVEGDTLAAFMREFPRYTRVNWDKTSLGAQIFTAISRVADELVEAGTMATRARFPMTTPLYEQGLVYEWNYNEVHNLDTNPAISGRLGDTWFDIPLVRDEQTFWTSPPTRLETTTAEVDGLTLLDWTNVGTSGLVVLLNTETFLPLHNQIIIEVSGIEEFTFAFDDSEVRGNIYIRGHWPHEGFRPRDSHMEEIPIFANAPIASRNMYRSIERVEVRGMDPRAYVKVKVLNFNSKWKSDSLLSDWSPTRGEFSERVFWQLTTKNTSFSGMVQPENYIVGDATSEAFLARTRLLTDTIYDQDLEWDILETWKISDPDGVALSGIVDIAPVPNARFVLLLGSDSKVWVVDTYRPAISMKGYAESSMAPARIQLSSPKDSSETPGQYTIALDAKLASTSDGVQRWRWVVNHHAGVDIIPLSGTPYPFHHLSGWQSGQDETVVIPPMSYIISGAGQYIFELDIKTDTGAAYQTYAGYQQIEKRALGELPIRGLTINPSGIEFDSYGRPWVSVSGNAVRLVMRTDTGIWVPEQRVLLTRENYDEVKIF